MIYTHPPVDYGRDHNAVTQRYGGRWSHLATDGTLEELIAFGAKIGCPRSWLQGKPGGVWHFDLTPSKWTQAVKAGAKNVEWIEFGRLTPQLLKRGLPDDA